MNEPQQGHNERRSFSPSASVTDSTGKSLAMAAFGLSAAALGAVIVLAILVPEIVQSRSQSAAAAAEVRASIAEREARVAVDQVQTARIELAKKGIYIQLDDHQ